jgi:hypothetical protein
MEPQEKPKNEWEDKGRRLDEGILAPGSVSDETLTYSDIKCSVCPFSRFCKMADLSDTRGCRERKDIHDNYFSKIVFNTDDPITTNRLRLVSHYQVELMLKRRFGIELTSEEIMLLKQVEATLEKLFVSKQGDLKDVKSKAAIPWEQDSEVKKLKQEVEEARSMKAELEVLRAAKKKAEEKKEDR